MRGLSPSLNTWKQSPVSVGAFLASFKVKGASLVFQTVKNLPAVRETRVPSLGWEDPLEEGKETYTNSLAWRIPMERGAWQATVHGVVKSWT